MEITAQQLAAMVNGTVDGDASAVINNYAKIEEATSGCLTFLANPKYTHFVYTTQASAILVSKDFVPEQEVKATLIRVNDPYETLAHLLNFVNSQQPAKQGLSPSALCKEGSFPARESRRPEAGATQNISQCKPIRLPPIPAR